MNCDGKCDAILASEIKKGDRVRAVGTADNEPHDEIIFTADTNGSNAGVYGKDFWLSSGRYAFYMVKKFVKPLPTEPGTVVKSSNGNLYVLLLDGRWTMVGNGRLLAYHYTTNDFERGFEVVS